MNQQESTAARIGRAVGTGIGVLLILAFPIGIIWGTIQLWIAIPQLTTDQWATLGEIARNTGAFAVLAASIAAYIAWGTNRTRAAEATSTEFRDQMKWAVDALASGDPIKTTYAQMLIQRYAEDKPKLLKDRDHQLALDMWAITQALYGEGEKVSEEEELADEEQEGQNESE